MNELTNFSKIVKWYPEQIKVQNDHNCILKDKNIEVTDIFFIGPRIISFMQRSIRKEAENLINMQADFNTICELIKEIRDDRDKRELNLKKFDEEYKFLEEYLLLKIIYQKVRDNYFNILLENLRILYNQHNQNNLTEIYKKNYLAKLERRKENKTIYEQNRRANY